MHNARTPVGSPMRLTHPPLPPGQVAIVRLMQAGHPLVEGQRSDNADIQTFDIKGNKANGVRKSAVAALVAHGLIERGAKPIDQIPFYYRHDIYHWSLTAKGKDF
ncbi:hypothetical protein [Bradyrhizobium sp. S69]|uniref:hypothetical protein n=1 Tax=Bradyrhizobium sp. S69 TaxID=1641856 RepID=UPI00131D03E6|nr:hypothetical protein [Bradyrhizobium sp. S69]